MEGQSMSLTDALSCFENEQYREAVSAFFTLLHEADAMYGLAWCFYHGLGVGPDSKEAMKWFELAAEKEHAYAIFAVSYGYFSGVGVERNALRGFFWNERTTAVTEGLCTGRWHDWCLRQRSSLSLNMLGFFCLDPLQAVQFYKEAAEKGDAAAQNALGQLYRLKSPLRDVMKAFDCFNQASAQDYAVAQQNLGKAFYLGTLGSKDFDMALYWTSRAATEGYPEAEYLLGYMLFEKDKDDDVDDSPERRTRREETFGWFLKAAEHGHKLAYARVGNCYDAGYGVEQSNDKAAEFWTKAASYGDYYSMVQLGFSLFYGDCGTEDVEAGLEWLVRGAPNSEPAREFLCKYFSDEYEAPSSPERAERWLMSLLEFRGPYVDFSDDGWEGDPLPDVCIPYLASAVGKFPRDIGVFFEQYKGKNGLHVELCRMLEKCPNLTGLGVDRKALSDGPVDQFMKSLKANTSLTELGLCDAKLNEEAFKLLADALRGKKNLECLRISSNYPSDKALSELVDSLCSSALRVFLASEIRLSDAGCVSIARLMISCGSLRRVGIDGNHGFGKDGEKALALALKQGARLTDISVGSRYWPELVAAVRVNGWLLKIVPYIPVAFDFLEHNSYMHRRAADAALMVLLLSKHKRSVFAYIPHELAILISLFLNSSRGDIHAWNDTCSISVFGPVGFKFEGKVTSDVLPSELFHLLPVWGNCLRHRATNQEILSFRGLRNVELITSSNYGASPTRNNLPCLLYVDSGNFVSKRIPPQNGGKMIMVNISEEEVVNCELCVEGLEELEIRNCLVRQISSCIGNLKSLRKLTLTDLPVLESIPEEIGELSSLIELELRACSITSLPKSIGELKQLESMKLICLARLTHIPEEIGELASLHELEVSLCCTRSLPASIGRLVQLRKLTCTNLECVPDELRYLSCLKELVLGPSDVENLPSGIGELRQLEKLQLFAFSKLTSLPDEFKSLSSLKELEIRQCPIESFPKRMNELPSLKIMALVNLPKFQLRLEDVALLSRLEHLFVSDCCEIFMDLSVLEGLCKIIKQSVGLRSLVLLSLNPAKLCDVSAAIRENGSITRSQDEFYEVCERNAANLERAKASALCLMAISSTSRGMTQLPKGAVTLIGKMLLLTRCDFKSWGK